MFFLYNTIIHIAYFFIKIIALFNKKLSLFVKGREESFAKIKQNLSKTDKVFWVHVASLGEYEQGLPLMEALIEKYPTHKILLTFFSPSGYEVKKNNTLAHCTIYLPMDTTANAKKLLEYVNIEKAFFIKYEYWPNYLHQLKQNNIPTYLISGIFRENQIFFKWYAGFYRKALDAFTYFFVQNQQSLELLHQLNHYNVEVVGDTRFDRVSQILQRDNNLEFLDRFTLNKTAKTIVIGSSWPDDEKMLAQYINQNTQEDVKFIFAPHNIKQEQIQNLQNALTQKSVLHTQSENANLSECKVYIIDAYSLLTKAYSYGDIAYVGGGFTHGIHNILEAATFGIPIIIGPKYQKFQEAKDLIALKATLVVHNQEELDQNLDTLLHDQTKREQLGKIAFDFINKNKDATAKIMNKIQ
ncbi:3-deoxy-D-manno-octulosonic acid transferase [Myroides sp. LJL115]